ncbi:MAG: glutathione peroxidase [Ferrovum sp. 37-45-19]|nr:MAG: glutathione peroxidase [Ferrovum sp. 21-44-67]OYV94732.1 MAG: glutathione peroxidase [Ferrovum sp. 37-45-19]OZB31870.1 MAG: glutathione peroxidase [Ferrovum sp. 34-44-207]HQT81152.1 glutathione peroxidase [Ferrovaceae bacterium]HQU06031.1 glutathione peroxidase [Ferrovaceae bacterium]
MKLVKLFLVLISTSVLAGEMCPTPLNFTFPRLQDNRPQNLCQYKGKVVLVVNTASYCGFTPQYEGLERLYSQYKSKGLVILGFPSNNFGHQEPGSNQEIAEFCSKTYGVKFPMFGKSDVVGANTNPLFKLLSHTTQDAPSWNFHKYLIDKKGHIVGSYASDMDPESSEFQHQVNLLLAEKP